jgi:hypothetical protein
LKVPVVGLALIIPWAVLPDCCKVRNEGAFTKTNDKEINALAGVGLTAGSESVVSEPVYSTE